MNKSRYWSFSRVERAAVLVLVGVIVALIYLFYINRKSGGESYDITESSVEIEGFINSLEPKPVKDTKKVSKAKAKPEEKPKIQDLSPKFRDNGN